MNMSEVLNAIQTMGFPIVCCLLVFWYVKYTEDKNRQQIETMNKEHKEEVEKMVEAINNNTLVIQKLLDNLEGVNHDYVKENI